MSFFLLVAYMFFTFIRLQDWHPAFINKPIVLIISLSTIFFIFVERFGVERSGLTKVPQNILMVGLYFAVLMSHLSNTYFEGLMEALQSFLIIFMLYFIILNGISSGWKFKSLVWVIVILITVLVFQGMYQSKNMFGWAHQFITIQGGITTSIVKRINWVGIFSDPNDLALIFVMAIGIVMAFAFGRTSFFIRLTSFVFLGYLL